MTTAPRSWEAGPSAPTWGKHPNSDVGRPGRVTRHVTATAVDFASSVTIEVRKIDYFRSLQNGSGGNPGFLNNYARDTIAVGGTVTWEWVGQNHNVSAAFGSTTSDTHDAPHTYQITFNTPGTFTYRCTNHSQLVVDLIAGMAGIIEVR